MSAAESRSVLDRWLAAWNSHEIDALVALVTDDYKRRDPSMPDMDGPDAQRELVTALIAAFPDLHFEETHRIAEDDLVVSRLIVTGTHSAELLGIPPTGNKIDILAQEIYRIRDGKIAEQYVSLDGLGLLRQLGALPAG